MAEIKNIPELRFPEYTGKWNEKKFGELYTFKSTNSFSRDMLNYENGSLKNIHYGDIHTKFNLLFDINKEEVPFVNSDIKINGIADDNYVQEGDLILADASEDYNDIGKSIEIVNLNKEKVVSGLHTILSRQKTEELTIGFMAFLMKTYKVRLEIMRIAQGTKVLGLSSKRLAEIPLWIPQKNEQEKIASFLTAIDKRISLLAQQKKQLERYKKGLMQKIFNRELRFKDENGNDFPEWEEKTLGDVSINVMYGLNSPAIEYNGTDKYIRITDINENNNKFTPNPLTSPEGALENSYLVRYGDILFARTGASTGKTYIYERNDGKLYFAGFLIRFSIIYANPLFIFYQTQTLHYKKWVKVMSMRSGQPGINAEEFKSYKFRLPSPTEQQKIVKLLNLIDAYLNNVSYQLKESIDFRKGLLQKLFV